MATKEKTDFEEDQSDSTPSPGSSSTPDSDSDSHHEIIDSSDESRSDTEEEILKPPITAAPVAFPTIASVSTPIETSPPSIDSIPSVAPKKTVKSRKLGMTRLQENDLLLAIYDALSTYRRPSSKPSLDQKLESVDNTINLLQKLRSQLQLHPPAATKSSSSKTASTSVQTTPLDSSSSSATKFVSPKLKKPEKLPSNPFQVFCVDRRKELIEASPKLSAAEIRSKMEGEWKVLSAARLEVFCARFQLQVSHGALMTPLVEHYQLTYNPTSTPVPVSSSSKGKSEEACKVPSICKSSFFLRPEELSDKKPEIVYWTMRTNVTREDLSKRMAIRMFSVLRTSLPCSAIHLSRNGTRAVLKDNRWAHVYEVSADPDLALSYVLSVPIIWEPIMAHSLCLSSDGEHLYVGDGDNYLRKWNLQTNRLEVEVSAHKTSILHVSLSPNGKWVATGSADRHLMLYDADSLKPWRRLGSNEDKRLGPKDAVSCVAFSPDSVYVACASLDCCVRVWKIESGELVKRFDGHEKACVGICWRNSEDLVSVSLDNTVKYWSLAHDHPSPPYSTPGSPVSIVSDPVNGKALWTGGKDCCVRMWNPPLEVNEKSKEDACVMLLAHTAPIVDLSTARFNDDCVLLATVSSDGVGCLWKYSPI